MLGLVGAVPWLPPMRREKAAVVNLDNCNGCRRCEADCPYNAITMQLRSDGKPFEAEAVVDPSLCVSCGICAGACPTSTPFRRMSELVPGIDLPDRPLAAVRADLDAESAHLAGAQRVMIFSCRNAWIAEAQRAADVGVVTINCAGHLPPAFIDYTLSRRLAEAVVIAGCAPNACSNRFGMDWTDARIAGERDPYLRTRVPRERLRTVWAGRLGGDDLARVIAELKAALRPADPAPAAVEPAPRESEHA
jgi:ferredoxin/coenzyme F420-reducing hydrogenase delta subunit